MHKSEVSRNYFKKLFTAFLCSSIIPLVICVIAILFINYKMTVEEHDRKVTSISNAAIESYENLIDEYNNILYGLSDESSVQNALINNDKSLLNEVGFKVDSLLTGRKGKIEIHIIDYDSPMSYDTNTKSSLYDQSIYSEWGILYKTRNSPYKVIIFPSNYYTENGQTISLSMGKAILDNKNNIIGYVILDVYRSTLLNQLPFTSGEDTEYLLSCNNNVIILDTTSHFKEGFSVLPEKIVKWNYKNLNQIDNDKNETIFVVKQEQKKDFSLFTFVKVRNFHKSIVLLIKISLIIVVLVFLICFIVVKVQVRRLYRPIETVVEGMQKISEGNIQVRIKEDANQDDEMSMVAKGFNKMLDEINILLERVVEQTEREKNAEIKALQAQISPHFLYNMLNEIKALAKLGRTEEVSTFVISLGKLLRHSISYQEKFVTLEEDLLFLNDYLELQKVRYDNNFEVVIEIDESILNCKIPNLILQPIIENSIVHGLESGEEESILKITGGRDDKGRIKLEVYDNGVGVDEEYMQYINNTGKSSSLYGGLGLENVQKRLLLTYGSEYGIKIESEKDSYTKVIVILPYQID